MRNQSPISATNAKNIAITGFGIIDGSGEAWRMVKKEKLRESNWKKLVASGGVLNDDKKIWYPSESSLKGSKLTNPGQILPGKTTAFYEEVKDFFVLIYWYLQIATEYCWKVWCFKILLPGACTR